MTELIDSSWGRAAAASRTAATTACVEGRTASAVRVTATITRSTGSLANARSAIPGWRGCNTRSGNNVTAQAAGDKREADRRVVGPVTKLGIKAPVMSRHDRWTIFSQIIPT